MWRVFSREIALYASFRVFLFETVQSLQIFCSASLACRSGRLWRSLWFTRTFRAQSYLVWMSHICMRSSSLRETMTGSLWTSPSVSHFSRLGLPLPLTDSRRKSPRASALALFGWPYLIWVPGLADPCLAGWCTRVRCKLDCCTKFCLLS